MPAKNTTKKIKAFSSRLLREIDPSYTIQWKKGHRPRSFTWSGDGVLRASERDVIMAIHDVAHVMIASPRRRRLPEFGLGQDPMNSEVDPLLMVSPSYAQREEEQTCDLHWALVAHTAGPRAAEKVEDYVSLDKLPSPRAIRRMAARHNLPNSFIKNVLKVRKERMKTFVGY